LALDGSGSPIGTVTEPTISVTGLSNGAADLSVTWDLVDVSNSSDITGFDQPSATFFTSQNGRAPGTIQDLTIGEDGVITGIFSNGGVLPVYQVALADFAAPAELEFRGLNLFRESSDSGQAVVGAPGQGGLGKVDSRSLEASNVDLTSEFVNLIAAQRGFQANTRVISVGNEILLETVNLTR
jgi:flagellar hook protein FlgE